MYPRPGTYPRTFGPLQFTPRTATKHLPTNTHTQHTNKETTTNARTQRQKTLTHTQTHKEATK